MKKTKLYFLLTALLFAGSTIAVAASYIPQGVKEVTENPNIETEILEVGDGLAVSRIK